MTLTLATVTREEIKKELAEAVFNGDIVTAKVRLAILEELITEEGFESVEEIDEYYQVRHFINHL